MAAYHSIAVTLGQAGRLNDLIKVIECMRQKPLKRIKNMRFKNWDPVLEPDIVVYNAVRQHFYVLFVQHFDVQIDPRCVWFSNIFIILSNAQKVLNACVPTHQWKGVSWVFKQLRACGLKPNGATYGLAMEVAIS